MTDTQKNKLPEPNDAPPKMELTSIVDVLRNDINNDLRKRISDLEEENDKLSNPSFILKWKKRLSFIALILGLIVTTWQLYEKSQEAKINEQRQIGEKERWDEQKASYTNTLTLMSEHHNELMQAKSNELAKLDVEVITLESKLQAYEQVSGHERVDRQLQLLSSGKLDGFSLVRVLQEIQKCKEFSVYALDLSGRNVEKLDLGKKPKDPTGMSMRKLNAYKAAADASCFRDAIITEADFRYASLDKVDFTGAKLNGSQFWMANVNEADFSSADLSGTDISIEQLRSAIINTNTILPYRYYTKIDQLTMSTERQPFYFNPYDRKEIRMEMGYTTIRPHSTNGAMPEETSDRGGILSITYLNRSPLPSFLTWILFDPLEEMAYFEEPSKPTSTAVFKGGGFQYSVASWNGSNKMEYEAHQITPFYTLGISWDPSLRTSVDLLLRGQVSYLFGISKQTSYRDHNVSTWGPGFRANIYYEGTDWGKQPFIGLSAGYSIDYADFKQYSERYEHHDIAIFTGMRW